MRSAVDETDDDMYTQRKLEGSEGGKNRLETLTSCSWVVKASAILKPPQRRSGRAHWPRVHAQS